MNVEVLMDMGAFGTVKINGYIQVEFRAGACPYDDNRFLQYPAEFFDQLAKDPDVKKITSDTGKVLLSR